MGILRREFTGLSDSPRDVWIPFTTYADLANPGLLGVDQPQAVEILARLKPGTTAAQAQAALTPFMARVVPRTDDVRADVTRRATPNPLSLQMAAVLAPVFAAFGLVLVAACANVSNVMLARAASRHREIAVRLSLGASRGRLVRQLLTEGLLIAMLAGAAGLALASWLLRGGTAAFSSTLPPSVAVLVRLAPIDIDFRVFIFCLAVCAVAPLMFALLPAIQASRLTLMDVLRGHGAGALGGSRLRSLLVGSQVAIGTVLVILAVTLARNGAAIAGDRSRLSARRACSRSTCAARTRRRSAGWRRCCAPILALRKSPGAPAIRCSSASRDLAASPSEQRALHGTRYTFVTPEYFPLLQIPIDRGRGFRADEAERRRACRRRQRRDGAGVLAERGPDRQDHSYRAGRRPAGGRSSRLLRPHRRRRCPRRRQRLHHRRPGSRATSICRRPTTRRACRRCSCAGAHPADLAPAVLDGLFRQVAADPQLFEPLPLDELRCAADLPAACGILDWHAARGSGADAQRGRALRCAVVHDRAADAGDRHPHGARRDRHERGPARGPLLHAPCRRRRRPSASSRRSSPYRCSARPSGCARFRWWTARRSPLRWEWSCWRRFLRPISRRAGLPGWTRRRRCGRRGDWLRR